MTDAWPAELMVRLQRDADEIGRLTAELATVLADFGEVCKALGDVDAESAVGRVRTLRADLAAERERAERLETDRREAVENVEAIAAERDAARAELDAAIKERDEARAALTEIRKLTGDKDEG